MYKVFTILKNIYKFRITLKKNKIFNSHKTFFFNYVVPYGTARREWVKDGGPNLSIYFAKSQVIINKGPQISHEELNDFFLKLGLYDKMTFFQVHAIKSTFGRSSIKPRLSKYSYDVKIIKTFCNISNKASKKDIKRVYTICSKSKMWKMR